MRISVITLRAPATCSCCGIASKKVVDIDTRTLCGDCLVGIANLYMGMNAGWEYEYHLFEPKHKAKGVKH